MFLAAFGEWGGIWELDSINLTGNEMFDYFFTLVMTFGVLSMMVGWLFRMITRS